MNLPNIIELQSVNKTFNIIHEKRTSIFEYLTTFYKNKNIEKLHILKNVSFSIKKGEMIGVIGFNGSGKTTLLKTIAKIIVPDNGSVIINGKIIPFLEMGVGFQGELTAKDNIILNGMLLGLSKKEIIKKINKIIKFAELENFLDTKIKHFSTGMVSRLAFSIAIEINPDILLVDEILSVGDIQFQKKSFNEFMKFRKQGKTIVYVSHDIERIKSLCDRIIWIHNGLIMDFGPPVQVIEKFYQFIKIKDSFEKFKTSENLKNKVIPESKLFDQSKLFFIIGCGRSGTTLLQEIMNTFEGFCNVNESWTAPHGVSCYAYVQKFNDFTNLEKYIQKNWTDEFFVENTPNSIFSLTQLSQRFPNANYLFLERDPYKILLSVLNYHSTGKKFETKKLRQYVLGNTVDENDFLLDHEEYFAKTHLRMIQEQTSKKSIFKNQIIIKYEDLINDLESQLKLLEKIFSIKPNLQEAKKILSRLSASSKYNTYDTKSISDPQAKKMVSEACSLWNYDFNET